MVHLCWIFHCHARLQECTYIVCSGMKELQTATASSSGLGSSWNFRQVWFPGAPRCMKSAISGTEVPCEKCDGKHPTERPARMIMFDGRPGCDDSCFKCWTWRLLNRTFLIVFFATPGAPTFRKIVKTTKMLGQGTCETNVKSDSRRKDCYHGSSWAKY